MPIRKVVISYYDLANVNYFQRKEVQIYLVFFLNLVHFKKYVLILHGNISAQNKSDIREPIQFHGEFDTNEKLYVVTQPNEMHY